ncbi:hypothetical protein OBV_35610 [Oscillibacter valericigenes Sjm18-20]|nr:hypothetical protein OBV_35610 [Oscillibacter valericigenes Sjm18-20]
MIKMDSPVVSCGGNVPGVVSVRNASFILTVHTGADSYTEYVLLPSKRNLSMGKKA